MESDGNDNFNFDMAYAAGGQAIPMFGSGMSDHIGNMFSPDNGLELDDSDPKRRRIARACDMCRKKKIKCDGKLPRCGHCINYKTECVFTQVEKKRNPPKGAKYIEGLENRLGRMEALLKMSGLLSAEEAGKTDLGTIERRLMEKTRLNSATSPAGSPSGENGTRLSPRPTDSQADTPLNDNVRSSATSAASPSSPSKEEKGPEMENLADMMCSLVTNSNGETRYIGSSSAFSIFSSRGIDWINEKTGDTSFEETVQNAVNEEEANPGSSWKPEIFGDLFIRRIFKPLPPKEEAMVLFDVFFENFNSIFPLFHEPTFMHLVERQYSNNPYEGSGWWACINVTLAIAHRIRILSEGIPKQDDQKAWLYLKNALGVLTELTMRNQDLLSVQALFGMALYLQGTPNPQPAFQLVSAGMRLAHSIGLHKKGTAFNLHPIEAEQRKRVFWIGYMLDKDSCLRSGRPAIQDEGDMNVDLPSADPPDNIGNVPLADGKGKLNLFRTLIEFCLICGKVYRLLYSVAASKQTDGELLNTIGDLDKELEAWKDSIPIEFRPEHEIRSTQTALVFQIVVLHFSYYNCLTTIHRMAVHHGYWTSRLSEYAIQGLNSRPLNPRVFSSAALCVQASRASIHLLKYLPQGDFACVWLIIYFPVSALVTLFANVLQNPQDQRAKADIKLMELVVNFVSNVSNEEGTGAFRRMLNICIEFLRISKLVLERAEKEGVKRKRKVIPEDARLLANQPTLQQLQQLANNGSHTNISPKPSIPANQSTAASHPQQKPNNTFQPQPISTNFNDATSHFPQSGQPFSQQPSDNFVADPISSMQEYNNDEFANILAQNGFSPTLANEGNSNPLGLSAGGGMAQFGLGSFQQPFVPQDLWQMPMTFEWDIANNFDQGYGSNPPFFGGGNEDMNNMNGMNNGLGMHGGSGNGRGNPTGHPQQ